jgi:aspartyl-tRNA(Asn)/glutamyl-tRNA(Gln) amidotransferase subunit A
VTVNLMDRCALTIPCHRPGEAPVGLMVIGETMGDHAILAIGRGIEAALA